MDGSGGEDQEGNGEKEGHFKDGAGGLLMFFIEKQKTRTKKNTHTHIGTETGSTMIMIKKRVV